MPYANEHSCRLRDPGDFQSDSFRRTQRKHDGKSYSVIMGRLKGEDTMTEQAYRYPKGTWEAGEAKAHCTAHDGIEFEPASESDKLRAIVSETGVERRYVPIEVRVEDDEEGTPHVRGYGAVFGQWSEELGMFREMVERGAFKKTLKEADIRSLWNHNPDWVLGRNKAGTLRLFEDDQGLGYDVMVPDTQWARDLLVTLKRGDVSQSSFGFEVIKDTWGQDEDGRVTRRLVEVRLYDVGPVTFPAYPQTSAEARTKALEFTSEPAQAGHSEDDNANGASLQARLDILRRKLDLAEIE